MRINTNTAAMNTYSNLTSANASKSNSLAKLSSGLRINKAGDDAAGLAISEKMKNQISGMAQASRNAQDGISLIQTAEGALGETHSILNRMRDLTVQASNGTNTEDDKTAIQAELTSLTKEVDRIAGDTEFNTKGLMNAVEVKDTSVGNKFGVTSPKEKADNKLIATAINGNLKTGETLLADTGTETITNIAGKLKDLSPEKLDKVVADYNKAKSNQVKADQTVAETFSITTTATDFDAVAAKYGVTASGTNVPTAGDIQDLNDAIAAEEASPKLTKADLGDSKETKFEFQIGANAGEKISVEIENMTAKGLDIDGINVNTQSTDDILGKLDEAISSVSTQRANLGAVQNRLDHTVSNLATTKENLSEANSRITDVDMAEEMMSFTKSNILSQASTSMLAQANQMPQSVLSLLQ